MGGSCFEGYPLISVAMKQNGDADKFINEYRQIMHQHVTYKTGVREMINELKKVLFRPYYGSRILVMMVFLYHSLVMKH